MEVRPGYKQTEVGVIPEDWRPSTIGAEADLLTGFPFRSNGFVASGVRLLRGSNVKRGELDWQDDITEHWPSMTRDIQKYALQDGDVVVAMDGALVGRSYAVVASLDVPALLVQRVARIRSQTTDLRLLGAWIGSEQFVRYVDSVKTHTAIPHISPRDIREFALPLPTEGKEQRAIAAALSDVDALLGGLDRLVAKKRDLKQAAMQQLLTGQTRLPGFSGEWAVKRLGDVAHIKTGSRNNEDKVEDGGYPFFVRSEIVERINSYSHDCEAILVPGEGRIGEIFHYINGRFDVHQRVYAITQFKPPMCARFVHSYMSLRFGTWALQNTVKATVDSLRLPTFQTFEMHVPPTNEEQTAIADVLCDMDAELAALEQRREKTRDLKQAMMQELLTGKTRLVQSSAT